MQHRNAVALKIMLPELLVDPKSRERFQHEARVSSRIKSSHVVKVLAAGIDQATQTPWLAMEFLEGESLAAAHAAGVVHCDLKQENVFIADAQTVGVAFDVKVLDFGIARIVKEGRKSASVTTAVGSPHWLAPEQGSVGKTVSPPTDVWSFGLLAFWLLTGRYYWTNANVPDDDYNLYALLGEIAGKDPIVPPSERLRALGEGSPLLPAGFDGWFARCVDRDVTKRYATAKEAVEALVPVLGTTGGAAATVQALPSLPVGQTREMTVGVAGLAPAGRLTGGGTERIAERPRPSVPQPTTKRGAVIALAALAVVGLGAAAAMAKRDPSTPVRSEAPPTPATVVTPALPPTPVVTPPAAPACPEGMALIPAGTFTMALPMAQGEADEHPAHAVQVSAFCLDRTEVTVAAYRACVDAGNCTAAEAHTRDNWCNGGRTDRDNHPINCVDWSQAVAFCRARSPAAALPTEAQWEYAARGTDGRTYPWGNEQPTTVRTNAFGVEGHRAHSNWGAAMAHFGDDGWAETAPVGTYPAGASPFEIFDMAGNVWEWTSDWYGGYTSPTGASISDPTGPATGTSRVFRGGGWDITDPSHFRSANRLWNSPASRFVSLGFRCARGAI